jgi:hypothetical protein
LNQRETQERLFDKQNAVFLKKSLKYKAIPQLATSE